MSGERRQRIVAQVADQRGSAQYRAVAGFVDDLRFAQQTRVAVEVTLFDGQKFFTGVHDVDEQVGTVSLYEPQTFSDATTRRRVQLADITSVVVTEIDYTVD